MSMLALFVVCWLTVLQTSSASLAELQKVLKFRGGLVPEAKDSSHDDYYDQFELDYGTSDNKRIAGALKGFIKSGALSSLPESDSFLKWIFQHLEKGPEPPNSRLKAYYAADFGTKVDLKSGENPKVIIVGRKLQADPNGWLTAAPEEGADIEVRNIWQPWLKSRCNFVARYIVPNRINMIKILEQQGRFSSELILNRNGDSNSNSKSDSKSYVQMTFKPSLLDRCLGRRNIVIKHPVDEKKLRKAAVMTSNSNNK